MLDLWLQSSHISVLLSYFYTMKGSHFPQATEQGLFGILFLSILDILWPSHVNRLIIISSTTSFILKFLHICDDVTCSLHCLTLVMSKIQLR